MPAPNLLVNSTTKSTPTRIRVVGSKARVSGGRFPGACWFVKINGKKAAEGDLHVGYPMTVIDKDLVVWLQYESESNTEFVIENAE